MATQSSCAVKHVYVKASDLPVCCPSHHDPVWNAHPRVYLDIEKEGHVTCPYCGIHFQLES